MTNRLPIDDALPDLIHIKRMQVGADTPNEKSRQKRKRNGNDQILPVSVKHVVQNRLHQMGDQSRHPRGNKHQE